MQEIEAAKDIPVDQIGSFKLKEVDLGSYSDGSSKKSVVAIHTTDAPKPKIKLTDTQKIFLDLLRKEIAANGITPPNKKIPNGVRVAKLETISLAMKTVGAISPGGRGRTQWSRVKSQLLARRLIMVHEGYVWPS